MASDPPDGVPLLEVEHLHCTFRTGSRLLR